MTRFIIICFFIVSNFSLKAQIETFNLDFEEWIDSTMHSDSINFANYSDIYIENPFSGQLKNWENRGISLKRTTDATSGLYAALIHQWYSFVPGEVQMGNCNIGTSWHRKYCKNYLNERVEKVSGHYKYIPDTDTSIAKCQIILWKKSAILGVLDTLYNIDYFFAPSSEYTYFEIPIIYQDSVTIPDSLHISFRTHNKFKGGIQGPIICTGNKVYCNFLFIDDLKISIASTKVQEPIFDGQKLSVYPNPCSQYFSLKSIGDLENVKINIYNIFGKNVKVIEQSSSAQK
jgi:hypothetical protein